MIDIIYFSLLLAASLLTILYAGCVSGIGCEIFIGLTLLSLVCTFHDFASMAALVVTFAAHNPVSMVVLKIEFAACNFANVLTFADRALTVSQPKNKFFVAYI